jgi:tetratricopeptide (TPR) repeat protein
MRALKAAITIVIIAGAAAAMAKYVVKPYSCNIRIRRATQQLEAIVAMIGSNVRAAEMAKEVLDTVEDCATDHPDDVAAQMVVAAAYRSSGQSRRAVGFYETALQYDRRPELYLNLGQAQLESGEMQAGVKNLTQACIYNPAYLDEVGENYPDVRHAVDLYQQQLLQAKR